MKSLLTLALVGWTLASYAQFKGVVVEEVDNGGAVPGRTYRIYIELENDSDQVHMVYGEAKHPMSIRSSKPFFQSREGGAFSTLINRKLATDKADVRYDSWFTIGATDNYENSTTNFLLNTDEFEKTGGAVNTSDGAWFCIPGQRQTYAGSDRRILVMQLTTEGKITGQFSIMGRTSKGVVFHQYDITFTAGK